MSRIAQKATYVFTIMKSLLQQIKKRRLALGLKQGDMMWRVGMSRQQYQRLESKGNPRLDTLDLIAKGLNTELMLISKQKLSAVQAVLDDDNPGFVQQAPNKIKEKRMDDLSDNPWQDLLGDG